MKIVYQCRCFVWKVLNGKRILWKFEKWKESKYLECQRKQICQQSDVPFKIFSTGKPLDLILSFHWLTLKYNHNFFIISFYLQGDANKLIVYCQHQYLVFNTLQLKCKASHPRSLELVLASLEVGMVIIDQTDDLISILKT